MYTRKCPICNVDIIYKTEKNMIAADKHGSKCIKCRQVKILKYKSCIICSSLYIGQGSTCSMNCRMEKIKQTKIKKYGSLFNNRDKAKITVLKKYGVENVSQIPEVKTKVTNKGRYYTKPDAIVETVRRNINRKKPNLVKECLVCNTKFECRDVVSIRDKKYCSVKCYKQNVVNRFNTKPEIKFRNMLLQYSVPFNTQFYLKGKWFDFKINNTLIEIDGVYWHGKGILYEDMPQWRKQIFDNDRYKDRLANENNYKLIRIWEDELDNLNIQQLLNEIK